jgi:hypothetical protein
MGTTSPLYILQLGSCASIVSLAKNENCETTTTQCRQTYGRLTIDDDETTLER